MFSITVVNSTGEYVLFNTFDEEMKVLNPTLSLELNKSGTLTFQIASSHENRDQIRPLASEVYVYRDNTVYWIGRPIMVEEDFSLLATVTCEGVLGYLLDTQIPPFNFTESNSIKGSDCVRTFLLRLLNRHNSELSSSWVDQRKKFTIGNVTVYDSNNNLARSSEGFNSTLDTINDKLVSTHGGYLRVRYSGSTRYVDYIDSFGTATQPISFGSNLLDLTSHVKTEEIATNVIPLGALKENSNERVTLAGYSPTAAVKNQISEYTHGGAIRQYGISSSFSGFTGIYDKTGESSYGMVCVVQTWDDVTLQENLAKKAAEYIGTISVLGQTIDLSAVDLSQIDINYNSFNLGEMATVVSIPHNVNAQYQITQMNVDLYNPANSTLTLGGKSKTFTFDNTKRQADLVTELSSGISEAVQNATALLSGGLGGYLIIRQDESGQPYEILIMNQAEERTATNCVRINKNGIGFGTKATGQDESKWVYRNAWTIDGRLLADFITAGKLTAGTVGGFNIGTGAISKGTAGQNGSVYISPNIMRLGANFSVSSSGYLSASSGKIGPFSLSSSGLHATAANAEFSIYRSYNQYIRLLKDSFQVVYGSYMIYCDNDFVGLSGKNNSWISLSDTELSITSHTVVSIGTDKYIDLAADVRMATPPTGTGSTLVITSNHEIRRSSSSLRYKTNIKDIEQDVTGLYGLKIREFEYKPDCIEESDERFGKSIIGFIAEEVEDVLPIATVHNEKGECEDWDVRVLVPSMLKLLQEQKNQIDVLEAEIEKLKGEIYG